MIQEVLARHARTTLLIVTNRRASRVFHRRDDHGLEVLRRLKGIKVIDHLTQVEDHAIDGQLRHPARRIGEGHLLPCPFLDHRKRKASLLSGIGDPVDHVHGTARQVKQHHADAPVASQLERACGKVGAESKRLHGGMDFIARRLAYAIGFVDHTRHRLKGDTCGNSHIVH